jgi:hypothetical protein
MLRELFGDPRSDDEPWAEATHRPRERSGPPRGNREPSAARQRENLTPNTIASKSAFPARQ